MADSSESASEATVALPSELFRTIVSLLLFVHLFAVGLAMLSSSEAGSSYLLNRVKVNTPLLQPYLWQMWLDRGYDYRFFAFMPMQDETASYDWDNHLEATLNFADGRQKTVELPEADIGPSDRRQRLQQMAKFLLMTSKWQDGPDPDECQNNNRHLVGGSIGAALLRDNPGAKSVLLRWYYHRGLTGPEVRSNEVPTWAPDDSRYFVTIGRMMVTLFDDRTESIDIEPLGEVSPLKPRASKAKSTGATGANAAPAIAPSAAGSATENSSGKSKAESN
jgi:hypothetical protein